MSDEQPPSDETVESTPARQLLHAATGDRDAEARGTKPESDLAEPADVEGTDGG